MMMMMMREEVEGVLKGCSLPFPSLEGPLRI